MFINDSIKNLQISDIRKIAEKLNSYEDTINLTIGELT